VNSQNGTEEKDAQTDTKQNWYIKKEEIVLRLRTEDVWTQKYACYWKKLKEKHTLTLTEV
jgi:hypothetical protein